MSKVERSPVCILCDRSYQVCILVYMRIFCKCAQVIYLMFFTGPLQLRIQGYDSDWPNNVVESTLTININRNPGFISFRLPSYSETINGDFPVSDIVLSVAADDSDGVSLLLKTLLLEAMNVL